MAYVTRRTTVMAICPGTLWRVLQNVPPSWLLAEKLTNFCMMLSHPPRCLKGIPSSNKNMLAGLNMRGGGGGRYNKKTVTFCLADFGIEH